MLITGMVRLTSYLLVSLIAGCCCSGQLRLSDLQCDEGNEVRFDIPCPDYFDSIRFKKVFEVEDIVIDGELRNDTKYELDANKTHVILKECHRDDEGIYMWSCAERHYVTLEIRLQSDSSLVCFKGHNISFEIPCSLPEQFEKCRLKKRFQHEFIILDGLLNDHRFELDNNNTRLVLKECTEDDETTYVLKCEDCVVEKRFYLEVREHTD